MLLVVIKDSSSDKYIIFDGKKLYESWYDLCQNPFLELITRKANFFLLELSDEKLPFTKEIEKKIVINMLVQC